MELKKKMRSVLALGLAAAMSFSLVACGGDKAAEDAPDDGSEWTVDVFSATANKQGEQQGWFAKLVKDKFNITLNVIAPNVSGGDTVFDTRSAAGDLGDLIIVGTGNGRLEKLVKSGLIADMTPYWDDMEHVQQYQSAVDSVTELAGESGKDGIWGVPQGVSSQSPLKSQEGYEPGTAPYIRWDYYSKIGYPELKDLDDLLDALKQMQGLARQETGEDDIYAISLFKDWDGDVMQNAMAVASWFGYSQQGSMFINADGSDVQSAADEGGIYEQALAFLNKAERMGLVDPDSTTQDWDTMQNKVQNGKTMLSLWSWLGKPRMNSQENKDKGVGFMLAPLQNMNVYSPGFTPNGDAATIIAIGSKAEHKDRLAKFIDWLYSSEGAYASASNSGGSICPQELGCWTMEGDEPVLTEFGVESQTGDHANLQVPEDMGGSTYDNGVSTLNFKTIQQNDVDPDTGYTYNPQLWPSQQDQSALFKDWAAHMGNATSDINYLETNGKIAVAAGATYITPQEDSAVSATRSAIKTEIVNASWQAVMAGSEDEFDKILSAMRTQIDELGYASVREVDESNAEGLIAAREAVVAEYEENQ